MLGWGGRTRWESFYGPLKTFFMMSDVEGTLAPAQCGLMARELRESLDSPNSQIHLGANDVIGIALLIDALEKADKKRNPLRYG